MPESKYKKGMSVRRTVLGDEYVDKVLESVDEFTHPLQDFLTEHCWGAVWTREELPKSTRSLITVAILTALKSPEELKAHVHGALRNGCTVSEIQEVLLHSTVYCGAPAGIAAFRAAKKVIDNWQE